MTIFRSDEERELFLTLYTRTAAKYNWSTLTWALKQNHHHFAVKLNDGGLSEGLRELHGTYSRIIHAKYGLTRQGHLVRHGFFAREGRTLDEVLDICRYVDLNGYLPWRKPERARWDWCGHAAIMGWAKPRPFHTPSALFSLIGDDERTARRRYRDHVDEEIRRREVEGPPAARFGGPKPSPNEGSNIATLVRHG
jgi:REP element-mobilizing transposase RayT